MRRALLLAVVLAVLGAGSAQASHRVTLDASATTQTWRSAPMPTTVPVGFRIMVNGRPVHQHGLMINRCRYSLFSRRLALDIRFCNAHVYSSGKEPIRLRYLGSVRFTFAYEATP